MRTLAEIAKDLADAERWLFECPFADGQPFAETAARPLQALMDEALAVAMEAKDIALCDTIEQAMEGEYGDGVEAMDFWTGLEKWEVTKGD